MCKKNVQTGCTGYVHIQLSHVHFIRLSLSLGAWWPEGRSSSSVSQFLPLLPCYSSLACHACSLKEWTKRVISFSSFASSPVSSVFLNTSSCPVRHSGRPHTISSPSSQPSLSSPLPPSTALTVDPNVHTNTFTQHHSPFSIRYTLTHIQLDPTSARVWLYKHTFKHLFLCLSLRWFLFREWQHS